MISNGDLYGIRTRECMRERHVSTVSPTGHMALEVGLEPTTDRLTADCSTN